MNATKLQCIPYRMVNGDNVTDDDQPHSVLCLQLCSNTAATHCGEVDEAELLKYHKSVGQQLSVITACGVLTQLEIAYASIGS